MPLDSEVAPHGDQTALEAADSLAGEIDHRASDCLTAGVRHAAGDRTQHIFLFNSARNGNVTAQIFWLKTRAGWKETPSEHHHVGAIGTFDVREMSDEALERIVFGASPNLPPMSRQERRKVLAPVLQAIVSASEIKPDEPSTD